MPFDADLPLVQPLVMAPPIAAADPAPEMAQTDPVRLLAFLYVSPRPCAALDALLGF